MTKRLEILDTSRGIAALIVVIHHFMVFNGQIIDKYPFLSHILNLISSWNVEAVLFFFVLSGFCIALAQKGDALKTKTEINHYLYRRFKRIIPVYLLALMITLIIGLLIGELWKDTYQWTNLLGNLLFLQTSIYATDYWFSPYGNNGPLWSLAYEMFFYLFFPIYSFLLLKMNVFQKNGIQVIVLFLLSLICIAFNKHIIYVPQLAFLSYFVVWMAGYMAAELYLNDKKQDLLFSILLVLSILSLSFKSYLQSDAIAEIVKGLLFACLFYFSIRWSFIWEGKFFKFMISLLNKLFSYLGKGSFALYALHYPILIYMNRIQTDTTFQIVILVLLSGICPTIETYLAKKPFFIFKRNYLFASR